MNPGLYIDSLRLKKVICFDDAAFKVTPGITAIYGLNRTNARTSGNGNGAGKSAFFSQIGEILYESPIVGEKQDVVKGGARVLRTTMRGKSVVINKIGNKLDIKVEGKSRFRTKPMAKSWLAKNIPLNQEEYNTYVHLDARIPHPLVMGSSTERRRFFTSFFAIDQIDNERKLFAAELAKLGKVRAAYNEVVAEYRAAKEKAMPEAKLDALKVNIDTLEAELKDLNEKNKRLQDIKQLLSFEASAAEQLKAFRSQYRVDLAEISPEVFEDLEKDARLNLKQDQADLEDAMAWEQYQRDSAHYTKAFDALPADAVKLVNKLGLQTARKKCGDARNQARQLEESLREYRETVSTFEQLLAEPMPEKVVASGDKKEIRAQLEAAEHQYEHARKFKSGTCETCGQEVKVRDPSSLKARIHQLKTSLERIEMAEAYREAVATVNKYKSKLETAVQNIHDAKSELAKVKRYAVLADDLVSLPRKPQKFEGRKLESKIKQRMVDEDKERIQLLNFLQPNLSTMVALSRLTEKQRNAGSMAERLQAHINLIHERLSKFRAQLEVNAMIKENLARLRKKAKIMKAELANEESLRLLVEAYSDKAMKRRAIQAIGSRLMVEVNKYSRFVFPEDYTFDFKWETSQLSLLVHRKYGKKTLASDVRKLSGAESKLFTIVLVLALLTFVPAHKRCNLMILDEPTANFSDETTKAFMDLLPVLNKVIPSIIIITPKSKEIYEGATNWTMVKVKGAATLIPGHPNEHKRGAS